MRWVRLGLVAAFVLAAIGAGVLGNLARPDGDDPPPVSEVPVLSATAEIRRSFMAPGLVAIAVTNEGTMPVRITAAELVSESFAPTGPQEFDATIPTGPTPRDLQVSYGAVVCPDGVESTAAPSRVALTAVAADGAEHSMEVDLPHPNGTLDRLLQTDCGTQVLDQAIELGLGELSTEDDGTLSGVLSLTRVDGAAEQAGFHDVRGSVLFEVTAAESDSVAELTLHMDAHRCEGHAIGDAKQPYAFTVWLVLGSGEPIPTLIPIEAGHREALDAMQSIRCAP